MQQSDHAFDFGRFFLHGENSVFVEIQQLLKMHKFSTKHFLSVGVGFCAVKFAKIDDYFAKLPCFKMCEQLTITIENLLMNRILL